MGPNSGCYLDEAGVVGPPDANNICNCYLPYYFDNSTGTCKNMKTAGCSSGLCYKNDENWEYCPYCKADKYHDDHGGVLLLGYYDSGPGVWYTDEPQYYTGGTDTNCYKERSAKAYWYCWYDAYDDTVPLDHVEMLWTEEAQCEYIGYIYTPLACCWAVDETNTEDCCNFGCDDWCLESC